MKALPKSAAHFVPVIPLDKSLSGGVDRELFSSAIVDTPVDKSGKAAEDNCEPPRCFISPIDIVEEPTQINTHETAELMAEENDSK